MVLRQGKRPVSKVVFSATVSKAVLAGWTWRWLQGSVLKALATPLSSAISSISVQRQKELDCFAESKMERFFISELWRNYPKRQAESLRQFCRRCNKLDLELKELKLHFYLLILCAPVCTSRDSLWESVLSFHHVGSGDELGPSDTAAGPFPQSHCTSLWNTRFF